MTVVENCTSRASIVICVSEVANFGEEMSTIPSKAEVREAVEKALASQDELRKDPKALAAYLNDDRVVKWSLKETESLVRTLRQPKFHLSKRHPPLPRRSCKCWKTSTVKQRQR